MNQAPIHIQLPDNATTQEALKHINFNNSLGVLSLIISLGVQCSGRREFAAMCIVNAIKSPMQCADIISTVKSMIEDNEAGMRNILGGELCDKLTQL